MAYILNIETSTEVCSVAIGCDGDIVFHREDYRGQTHATALGVFVDEALGYADYEQSKLFADEKAAGADKADATSYGIGIGYQYPLSKRTYVYTAASWNRLTENDGGPKDKDVDTDTTEVMAGIVHNF